MLQSSKLSLLRFDLRRRSVHRTFEDTWSALRRQSLIVGRIARCDCAWLLVCHRCAKKVVVEVTRHQIEGHTLRTQCIAGLLCAPIVCLTPPDLW